MLSFFADYTMAQQDEVTYKMPDCIPDSELSLHVEEVDGAKNDTGYVYCIAEYDESKRQTGYFKIGTTANYRNRISDLKTGNVRELRWCGEPQYVEKRLDKEKAAHIALSTYAVDYGGGKEWFKVAEHQRNSFYDTFRKAIGK